MTTDQQVESVARAIYAAASGAERPCFGREPESVKRFYFQQARAAISAMPKERGRRFPIEIRFMAQTVWDASRAALSKSPGSPECTRYHADSFTYAAALAKAILDGPPPPEGEGNA